MDTVLDTAKAACALDYPLGRFRVIVLDDGNSKELATAVARFGLQVKALHYTSRSENVKIYSKNANLNWGLDYTNTLEGGASEFFAVLDVDMMPEPHWLRTLSPHLLADSRVALVNPPQNYYNNPADDRCGVGMFLIRLFDVVLPLLDRSDNAFSTGTGFIARRKAINEIGGFPTQSTAEGVLTSWMLKAMGWKTVFIAGAHVQWGLGPQSLQSFIRQCERFGAIPSSLFLHVAFSKEGSGALGQLLGSIGFLLQYTLPYWTATLNMVLIPFLLTLAGSNILISSPDHIIDRNLLMLAILDFGAQCLYGFVTSSLTGHRIHILNHLASLWVAPQQCLAILQTFGSFKRSKKRDEKYIPTGSQSSSEKEILDRAWSWGHLKLVFIDSLGLMHLATFGLCISGAALSLYYSASMASNELSGRELLSQFILRAGWPPFFTVWTAYVANAWIPISYAIFPYPQLSRKALLVEQADKAAVYPSQQAKRNWYRKVKERHLLIVAAYYLVVVIHMLYI
ncbi:hypothetical protein MMC24_000495 [Lignoscripta atroalba]|nr:hypothetical protein [Lignoscripta atroalba]